MRILPLTLALLLSVSLFAAGENRPNIIYLMADDLGFGDVGFKGYWTLEMFAVQPVRIYPGVSICQIFYHQIVGAISEYVSDK